MSPLRFQVWPSGEDDWVPPPPPLNVDEEGDSEIIPRLAGQIFEVAAAIAILAGGLAQVEPEELWFPTIAEDEAPPVQPVDDQVVIWIGNGEEEEFPVPYLEDESGQPPSVIDIEAGPLDLSSSEEEFVTNFAIDDALEDSGLVVGDEVQSPASADEDFPEQVVVTILDEDSGEPQENKEAEPTLTSAGEEEEFPTSISVDDESGEAQKADDEPLSIALDLGEDFPEQPVTAIFEDESGSAIQPEEIGPVVAVDLSEEEEFNSPVLEDESGSVSQIEEVGPVITLDVSEEDEFNSPVLEDESGQAPSIEGVEPTLSTSDGEEFPTSISVEEELETRAWSEAELTVQVPEGGEEELPVPSPLVPEDESGEVAKGYEEVLGLVLYSEAEELGFTISVEEENPEPAPHEPSAVIATTQNDVEELPEVPVGIPDDPSGDEALPIRSEVEVVFLLTQDTIREDEPFVPTPVHIWKLYRKSIGIFWPLTP